MKFPSLFLLSLVGFSLLIWVSLVLTGKTSDGFWTNLLKSGSDVEGMDNLLPTGFDEKSCLSRFETDQYRRRKPREASPYLLSKLRSYEARHRRCGVYTESYNKTVEILKSGGTYDSSVETDCRYIVWISFQGFGNKMMTMASAFLYALLTDRVVLADRGVDIPDLFCEPFPEVSWFLPLDFPLTDQFSFTQESNRTYGNLDTTSNLSEPYVLLYLANDYTGKNKHFFCDDDQAYLQKIPWLLMKSDVYILPGFFLIPSFEQELYRLFPEKESVFHLLGRYLLHPTNSVWELVTKYYQAYLSKADEIVGIQIRVFGPGTGPFTYDQILSCAMGENILPQVNSTTATTATTANTTKVAILMASLSLTFFEQIQKLYMENPTATGEAVGVFQPSHDGYQQNDKHDHNRKALAEIYLLSFADKLVTSGMSTFGYVAQSLGGLRAWILYRDNEKPPCRRAVSMEPCFHNPPYYDCKYRRNADTSSGMPHVRHCEDTDWGIKLF